MSTKHQNLDELLSNIANNIRNNTQINEPIIANSFPNIIKNLPEKPITNLVNRNIEGEYINNKIETVKSSAFTGMSNLIKINLPNVLTIGSYAFQSCASLAEINLPKVTYIPRYAFSDCASLKSIFLPNVDYIEQVAFVGCSMLSSIDLPKVTTIQNQAFSNCSRLTKANMPVLSSVGTSTFFSCSLETISSPLRNIGMNAFARCLNLKTAYLTGNYPLVVGSSAFNYCAKLNYVYISNISKINTSAFANCSKLSAIYLGGSSVASIANSSVFMNTPIRNSTYLGVFGSIYVPASLLASYQTASIWSIFSARMVGF